MSNGNQPLKVAKHLTKLFDSMAKLKLREGPQCNNAYAMIAKDGEHVSFIPSKIGWINKGWML